MNTQAAKRRGITQVSVKLWIEANCPATSNEWEKFLLLPKQYKVVDVNMREVEDPNGIITLTLESEDIPENGVIINLSYQQNTRTYGDIRYRDIKLVSIVMRKREEEQWKEVQRYEFV